MLRDEVLALLKAREGKPLSGEEMSRALGVSRAAVWKAMESLRDEGYVISSAPRRGYALEGSPDRLSAGELAGALAGRRVGRALVCLETVDSTNNEVKRRALAGAADGLAVVAEQQTGGRGRRGRSFVSPAGQGLYLSVLLRPRCPLEEVSALTAWTAVAVCNAVERVCGVRPGIKWPNDVILDGRKLCGILTELELEAESAALGASYLRLMGCFYFLSFMGHSYVVHYRGIGRMNITFWGTTLQIAVRVVLTYALAGAMGLDAVALATGLGWVAIVLFHSTVFLLELKGIGFRLPTRDEDSQPG